MLKLSFLYLLPCLKTFYGELTLRKWSLKRRMNTKQSCKEMFEHKMSRVASKHRSTRQPGENRIVRTLKEILKNLNEIE
jgi:hypothetical protein